MADWNNIGNMLQGVGAGFSGQLPAYLAAKTAEDRTAYLKDKARREALIQDFATGFTLINNGQIDAAKELFQNRVNHITRLGGDPSDTMGVLTRLNDPTKLEEVKNELGSFVQAAMATGALGGGKTGYNSTASNQMFKDGSVLQANRDGTTTFRDPSGRLVEGAEREAALKNAIGSGVWLAGAEAGARAGATQNAEYQYAAPIAGAQAQARATIEAQTAPQIAADTAAATATATNTAKNAQTQYSNVREYTAFDNALTNYENALAKVVTIPLGDSLRITEAQQAAQLAKKQVGASLKAISRESGEGVFAKDDREAMMQELPGISDYKGARSSGFQTLRSRAKGGLNLPQDYTPGKDAPNNGTPNPMEGKTAVNTQTGQKIKMVNGQWVPL
jgi:hypothetical protein